MTNKLFLVVEDHPAMAEMICMSLTRLETASHCVIAESPEQAKERLEYEIPDLVTIDLMYGKIGGKNSGKPGLDLLKYIFDTHPLLNILVYSSEPSLLESILKQAQFHRGSFVVVDKQLPPKDFVKKASMVLDDPGIKLIPSYLTKKLDSTKADEIDKITDTELEVLRLACQDCLTDTLIAEQVQTSRRTVQNQMQSIRDKLKIATTRSEHDVRMLMCNKAREKGLI